MYKGKYIISVIPARGGSKGIPRKNITPLLGKPLIAHSILQSLSSHYIDQTVVSTEDQEILEISKKYGAKVLKRPENLATDETPTEPVLINAIEQLSLEGVVPDYVVLLQPTSPIRRTFDIDRAIETIIDCSADSLLSVSENKSFIWTRENAPLNYDYRNRPRRQDKKWELIENGSIYVTKKDILVNFKNRLAGKISTYVMPDWTSPEIDTLLDFDYIEHLMLKYFPFIASIMNIKLVIFDVDGVFTDGSVYVDERGKEILKFSRLDGKGIELLHKSGIKIAVITEESSLIVKERMKKLQINYVYTGSKDKESLYNSLKKEFNLGDSEIAYCGDDIGDLAVIKQVGLSSCPENALDAIKRECQYVSPFTGGKGYVRDFCCLIIKINEAGKDGNKDKK